MSGKLAPWDAHWLSETIVGLSTYHTELTTKLCQFSPFPFIDYKQNSLAPYVKVFEQFLEKMEKSHKGERLKASGKGWAGKQAFAFTFYFCAACDDAQILVPCLPEFPQVPCFKRSLYRTRMPQLHKCSVIVKFHVVLSIYVDGAWFVILH